MRICHLGKYYPPAPGGIETHVRTLAQSQAALGCEVRVICVRHDSGSTTVERDGDVEVVRLGRVASVAKLDLCPDLVAWIRRSAESFDLFHMQTPNPLMLLGLWKAKPKTPWVVTHQSDVLKQKLRAYLLSPLENWVYNRAKVIMPTSPTYAAGSRVLQKYSQKLQVLPNGINLDPYLYPSDRDQETANAIRTQYAQRGPIWLGCGRLIYYKGFEIAIEALVDCPGTLIIVGDGPERPRLEALAKRFNVADRTQFVGAMPYQDVVPYYLAAEAFWFPSLARTEAFGIVQVEAMASGCPVINAQIPHSGVAWVSLHEIHGLTAPLANPKAFAQAALRLLENPGLRNQLANAAKERAIQLFDHNATAQRSLELYRFALDDAQVLVS